MKRPVLVTPLEFLLHFSAEKTLAAFVAAGFSGWRALWNRKALLSILDRYNQGEISDKAFKDQICAYFPDTHLSKKVFWQCWSAGLHIDPDFVTDFFNTADQKGVDVYLAGCTNPKHMQYFRAQIDLMRSENSKALPDQPLRAILSYQTTAKEKNIALTEAGISRLKQKGYDSTQITILLNFLDTDSSWSQWLNPMQFSLWPYTHTKADTLKDRIADKQCLTYYWRNNNTCHELFETVAQCGAYLDFNDDIDLSGLTTDWMSPIIIRAKDIPTPVENPAPKDRCLTSLLLPSGACLRPVRNQ